MNKQFEKLKARLDDLQEHLQRLIIFERGKFTAQEDKIEELIENILSQIELADIPLYRTLARCEKKLLCLHNQSLRVKKRAIGRYR